MQQHERIQVDPGIIADPLILGGKPVIDGTRISVERIMQEIALCYSRVHESDWVGPARVERA